MKTQPQLALTLRPSDEVPFEEDIPVPGGVIHIYEWAGTGPTVLLVHATGFHGRTWDAVARRLPGRRVIAADLRGHGRTRMRSGNYSWETLSRDLAAVASQLELRSVVGVGHSLGGYVVARAASLAPGRFDRLVLCDPVLPGWTYATPALTHAIVESVAHRRRYWTSTEELYATLGPKFPFATWDEQVFRSYSDHALRPANRPGPAGESFELACSPEAEAAIYPGIWDIGEGELPYVFAGPVRILRAEPQVLDGKTPLFAGSPVVPGVERAFTHGSEREIPEVTHFIPMQVPEVVAAEIAAPSDITG